MPDICHENILSTFLHGSPYQLEVGTILLPAVMSANFEQSPPDYVCLTGEADVAMYWARWAARKMSQDEIWVYEVEPLSTVNLWRQRPMNYGRDIAVEEARCMSARIIAIRFGGDVDTLPSPRSGWRRDLRTGKLNFPGT